jgi:enoyl-CoA hydratase
MRSDRLSAHESLSLDFDAAMQNELRRGMEVIASGETEAGATRFASGAGRHGRVAVDETAGDEKGGGGA